MVGGWWQVRCGGHELPAYVGNIDGVPFLLLDTSQAGGLTLDLRLYVLGRSLDIEVKTAEAYAEPNHGLTDAERMYFELTPETGRVIWSAEELYAIISQMVNGGHSV